MKAIATFGAASQRQIAKAIACHRVDENGFALRCDPKAAPRTARLKSRRWHRRRRSARAAAKCAGKVRRQQACVEKTWRVEGFRVKGQQRHHDAEAQQLMNITAKQRHQRGIAALALRTFAGRFGHEMIYCQSRRENNHEAIKICGASCRVLGRRRERGRCARHSPRRKPGAMWRPRTWFSSKHATEPQVVNWRPVPAPCWQPIDSKLQRHFRDGEISISVIDGFRGAGGADFRIRPPPPMRRSIR